MSNKRKLFLHIDAHEIERIYEQRLGGISIFVDVLHSRIDVEMLTGEEEQVQFQKIDEKQ
jgi:hypothetical protein